MITVSANRVGMYAQCPSNAGYWYIESDPTASVNPYVARAQRRGVVIHAATFGEVERHGGTRGTKAGPGPVSGGHQVPLGVDTGAAVGGGLGWTEYPEANAQVDSSIIWTFMDGLWPGTQWQTEVGLTTQLSPSIRLEGRLDCLGWQQTADGGAWILPDLKTSTHSHLSVVDGRMTSFDRQLLLYGHLVRNNVSRGIIPQIWRVHYNPSTRRVSRRQYPASEQLLAQACRYAVHVACSLEKMHMQHPLEWHRTMSCDTPYPCRYKARCARDTGAWYSDGVNEETQSDPSVDPAVGSMDGDPLGGDVSLGDLSDSLADDKDR